MAKLVLLFSLSSLLAFYIVFSYPSCTIVCLLVCVLFCFLELYMWLLDCLIFCNRLSITSLNFRQIIHICILCFDSFLPVPPPHLSWGFCRFELHFAGPEVWVWYTFALPCLFSSVCALSVCLWRILLCHYFLIFAFGWFICVLILLFRLVTSFLVLVFTEFMYCLNRSSFLLPLCSSPA